MASVRKNAVLAFLAISQFITSNLLYSGLQVISCPLASELYSYSGLQPYEVHRRNAIAAPLRVPLLHSKR